MNIEEIKELMDYCESKNLMYFEFVSNDKKIVFSKCQTIPEVQNNTKSELFKTPIISSIKPGSVDEKPDEKRDMEQKREALREPVSDNSALSDNNAKLIQIRATYVGIITFPEKILNGDVRISKNTDICTIEAMKIYNSIVSTVNGTIKEIFVEEGSLVEYDQLIMSIEADKV